MIPFPFNVFKRQGNWSDILEVSSSWRAAEVRVRRYWVKESFENEYYPLLIWGWETEEKIEEMSFYFKNVSIAFLKSMFISITIMKQPNIMCFVMRCNIKYISSKSMPKNICSLKLIMREQSDKSRMWDSLKTLPKKFSHERKKWSRSVYAEFNN